MKNLAGDPNADRFITDELERCGIPIRKFAERSNGEVVTSFYGELNGFKFTRAWYYWVVIGDMPLLQAKELYFSVVGRRDIRVVGHAGNIEPNCAYAVTRIDPESKKKVISVESWNSNMTDIGRLSKSMPDIGERFLKEYMCAVKPLETYPGFVQSYHVDSELGLYLLAREIEKIPTTNS